MSPTSSSFEPCPGNESAPRAHSGVWASASALLVALGSLVLAARYGFSFPRYNQHSYLVHGLVNHDDRLLPRDWYVREATDYHQAFTGLAAVLHGLGDGGLPFVVLDVALFVVSAWAVLSLARTSFGRGLDLAVVACWLSLALPTMTFDVMDSYVFGGYLQPSSIGSAGFLWALALFARGRSLASGFALAIGGLFHLNFLVLGIGLLGIAHVALALEALGKNSPQSVPKGATTKPPRVIERVLLLISPHAIRLWPWSRDVFAQMAAPALVFLWAVPQFWSATQGPAAEASSILFDVRAPHHYRPTLDGLVPFFAGQAAAWLVIKKHQGRELAVPPMLVRLVACLGGFVVVASLLVTVGHLEKVTQLFPWRIAPYATLLAFLVVVGTALRAAWQGADARSWLVLLGAFVLFAHSATVGIDPDQGQQVMVAIAGAVCLTAVARRLTRGHAALVMAFAVASVFIWSSSFHLEAFRPGIFDPAPKQQQRLFAWAMRETPIDALFLVPPQLHTFRYGARRSVVVDWKSCGMMPADVVAWGERIEDISGRPLRSKKRARKGYAEMDMERAAALGKKYGVDYVVFDKRDGAPQLPGDPVHEDKRYVVFSLRP